MTLQANPNGQCKVCDRAFLRFRSMQKVCGPTCARKSVAAAKKAEREQTRARRMAIKPRAKWLDEAQQAVNRYCRLRDRAKGCVSCDKPANWDGQWHGSHFRSVGAASAVRFNTWNIHKSCSVCNKWKSGNLSEYEPRLRALIGDAKVDWLRTQNQRVDYSVDYLRRLKRVFTQKANRLEKRNDKD